MGLWFIVDRPFVTPLSWDMTARNLGSGVVRGPDFSDFGSDISDSAGFG